MKSFESLVIGFAFAVSICGCICIGGQSDEVSKLFEPPKVEMARNAKAAALSESARARATIQYINHLNYVVAKLDNMNDLVSLQQEYENLTDDNLNMEVIPDETTMQAIVMLMEEVKNLQESNIGSVLAQLTFEQEKRDAIWKALPQPSMFMVSGRDPLTIATSLAISVSVASWTSVQNYYNAKAEAQKKLKEKEFDIAKDKLEYINEINKELFEAQWRLMRRYGIADCERVTRADARLFLDFSDVLKGAHADDYRRNELVFDIFRNHEKEMRNLPFYWMTRAAAAQAIDNSEDVLRSCREYFELYKAAPIVRRDVDACSMALLYISTMMEKDKNLVMQDKGCICRWLEFVMDTVRIPQWETKFAVAMIYRTIGEDARAKEILKMAFSEVYACVKVWEDSYKKKNIFRKTPALEKAYTDTKFGENWSNWRNEVEKLVPYTGYIWLAGALYEMGEKDIFEKYGCDRHSCGVSQDLISGKYQTTYPSISLHGDALSIWSNGLWEDTVKGGEDLRVSVDGNQCAWDDNSKYFIVPRMGKTLRISVRTQSGISLRYEYSANNLKEPSVAPVVIFPWSLEKEIISGWRNAEGEM